MSEELKCPKCGRPMRAVTSRDDGSVRFYSCTGYPECQCKYSADPENDNKPFVHVCPECGEPLVKREGKSGNLYVACFNETKHKSGKAIFFELDGKPRDPLPQAAGEFKCPECDQPLKYFRIRKGKNAGQMAFGCFNTDGHAHGKAVFFDDDGTGHPKGL